jgi:predicted RNA polymerase sigma factor
MAQLTYRQQAEQARADADAATLDNVRDRCLRAEAAWLAMAERQERIDTGRAGRTPAASSPERGKDVEHTVSGNIPENLALTAP